MFRLISTFVFLAAVRAFADETVDGQWPNPLILQRADPHVVLHEDGWYYFTATVPEYDRIELRRSRSLAELATAEAKVIWTKHATGPMGAHIWAPEIHFIDGKWYVYFAAGEAERIWNIRMYALETSAANPLEGEWRESGQMKSGWESFALDATTFVHRGVRYLCWAQHDEKIGGNTNLYLARMDSPTTIVGPAVMISKPELPWEVIRYRVNEAPAALIRNERIFLAYSASGTGAEYALGLLTAAADADLLDPSSWAKSPEPVFVSSETNAIYGPGHISFTTENGADVLVYHARSYREIVGDPLRDPNRHTRVQTLTWKADGTPHFGEPRPDDVRASSE
ncbi:MAG TPA: glycoside hydrolase family 43 protein [Candidatus Synoicihabitans sp.]|nr:glycoside hydrolase family 43 protein [Candidatus Synoicihabitans sp.]